VKKSAHEVRLAWHERMGVKRITFLLQWHTEPRKREFTRNEKVKLHISHQTLLDIVLIVTFLSGLELGSLLRGFYLLALPDIELELIFPI
jgi:hypothetical protein